MIIVTGDIGVGKTTVCRKLIDIVRNRGYTCGGILTCKTADEDIIIEDIQSGEREILASTDNVYQGPRTARYFFNPGGIDFGIQSISRGASAAVLIIDEIGPLELRGEGFAGIPELCKTSKANNCILVIRKGLLPAFLPQLPAAPLIFETTTANRDRLPREMGQALLRELC